MDKITELINKKDYYLVTELTSFKTRLGTGVPRVDMAMYDNNDNLVESFEGDEHDDYETVYDGLNEKLEKLFPEPLYKYEHIERLIEEIRDVESSVPEHLRNKPKIARMRDDGYKLLLKTVAQDNVILSLNLVQSSNIVNINAITFGNDLSRLHSYIHIIEEYLKVSAIERRKELNSVDNLDDLV